jgi:hypothetical protein
MRFGTDESAHERPGGGPESTTGMLNRLGAIMEPLSATSMPGSSLLGARLSVQPTVAFASRPASPPTPPPSPIYLLVGHKGCLHRGCLFWDLCSFI